MFTDCISKMDLETRVVSDVQQGETPIFYIQSVLTCPQMTSAGDA